MNKGRGISRREFVASAISTAAISSLRAGFASTPALARPSERAQPSEVPLTHADWRDQGVVDTTNSPFAKLHPVPVRAVTIRDGFWGGRREINVTKSIPSMRGLLEANGRMNNFRRLSGKSAAERTGPVYSDSDVYKWAEAAAFALQSGDRPELRSATEKIIADVVAAQQSNGYLNTYFVGDRASLSMMPQTQSTGHELYNMGHFLQGAIAYYRATGDRTMLDAGIRFVDDFLLPNFGPAPKKPIISGHPEIEMALIELYRITGDKRQLELASYILGGDDRISFPSYRTIYLFSGTPFTARAKLEGHAVRAMYACCGATDYHLETGDATYWTTLNALWNDMTATKMYITGGVGSRADGEAFGEAYELPNFRAYGESCAAIGIMMWNWRMLAATGDAKFTDVIERALYNGIGSGMSLDGVLYCYRNPLGFDPSTGEKIRNPWYDTTCCPPNLERTFASLPGYFYSTSKDGIYAHLYDNCELDWKLESGTPLKVTQKTNYPWGGDVAISVTPVEPSDFTFYLRIPGWARTAQVAVNGKAISDVKGGVYVPIRRRWSAGDTIRLQLGMEAQVLVADPRVIEDNGRVAVQRGPLVYCMEQLDQPSGVSLNDAALDLSSGGADAFQSELKRDLLGGVVVLHHRGAEYEGSGAPDTLYSPYSASRRKSHPAKMTMIPYYAWANREPSFMEVWAPVLQV